MDCIELNLDGIVGPTHNYSGLAFGNTASMASAASISHPRAAALQGLEKMLVVHELGVPQAVLPPHPRPNLSLLDQINYNHDTPNANSALAYAQKSDVGIFNAAFSAASMWTANAATISPPSNTKDNKTHITSANLYSNVHRAQEAEYNYKIFSQIFNEKKYFKVNAPLESIARLSDEGAANHSFICSDYGKEGLEVFVYGTDKLNTKEYIYPPRQTKDASSLVASNHLSNNKILVKQSKIAIDCGAFHNDVVCVGNKNVLIYHEHAFEDDTNLISETKKLLKDNFYFIKVANKDLDLKEAVKTYLFNSQIISTATNNMVLVAPTETKNSYYASRVVKNILEADNPITSVTYVDCLESMKNGGGPACLRLRVIMEQKALNTIPSNIIFNRKLYTKLLNWINTHYRESLSPSDLIDPKLVLETKNAMQDLEDILNIKLIF